MWLPLRVGTDLCLSLGWLKWILDNEAYDDAFVRRWTNAPFLWNPEKAGRTAKGWFMEMNGGIDMESRILTEADCDPEWIGQYLSLIHISIGKQGYARLLTNLRARCAVVRACVSPS